jgi:dipeptidase E
MTTEHDREADKRQIIAIGGLSPTSSSTFWRYLLQQSPSPTPRLGFLPTASADSDSYIARFYESFSRLSCIPSHLGLFGRVPDPAEFVDQQDIILVGGGNTKSMLGLWREWGLDDLLRDAWEGGTILAGFSAGAICWFAEALCDAWADRLGPTPGLGLLAGSCCPHYNGALERRPTYHRLIREGSLQPGVAIDNDCAVHFRGLEPIRVVPATAGAGAYSVIGQGGSISELPIDAPVLEN